MNQNRKLNVYFSVLSLMLLLTLFIGTTYALFTTYAKLDRNHFRSGNVKISVNDGGMGLFNEVDNMMPGDKLTKPLVIKNVGTADVYYKLYLDNIDGNMSNILKMNIYLNDQLVHSIHIQDFNKDHPFIEQTKLEVNQSITYTIELELPVEADNTVQNKDLKFDFVVVAVQAKNNPNRLFD